MVVQDNRHSLRTVAVVIILISAGATTGVAWEQKTHENIVQSGTDLVNQTSPSLYEEIYEPTYVSRQKVGAHDEDEHGRYYNHFMKPGNPSSALEYHTYYQIDPNAYEPTGGRYESAFKWGEKQAWGERNWQGAINAYGYTRGSRSEAYYRLGHVLHLVADLGQPDHATLTPHAGSSMTGREYNRKKSRAPFGDHLQDAPPDNKGFEQLIADSPFRYTGTSPEEKYPLFDYFNSIAKYSTNYATKSSYSPPIGVKKTGYIYNFYPGINRSQRAAYLLFGTPLVETSIDYTAGVQEYYHDIVNQPPYAYKVSVGSNYQAHWEDQFGQKNIYSGDQSSKVIGKYKYVKNRDLTIDNDEPLICGEEYPVAIEFGSRRLVPERMKQGSVDVRIGGQPVNGRLVGRRTWKGTYIAPMVNAEDVPVEIEGNDIHNHHDKRKGLPKKEYELDKYPGSPARATFKPFTHPWNGYGPNEAGIDRNHNVSIVCPNPPVVIEDDEDGGNIISQFIKTGANNADRKQTKVKVAEPSLPQITQWRTDVKEQYNPAIEKGDVPQFVTRLSERRMLLHLQTQSGSQRFVTVRTGKNGKVQSMQVRSGSEAQNFNPQTTIKSDVETIEQIRRSDKPADVARMALRNQTIQIKGNTLGSALKIGLLSQVGKATAKKDAEAVYGKENIQESPLGYQYRTKAHQDSGNAVYEVIDPQTGGVKGYTPAGCQKLLKKGGTEGLSPNAGIYASSGVADTVPSVAVSSR